jgi:hypothetical protein
MWFLREETVKLNFIVNMMLTIGIIKEKIEEKRFLRGIESL